MRLWHYQLLSVLPRQQLVAQWRELSACAGNILEKGTPNHILVNKIMHYPYDDFISYASMVKEELLKRNYKPTQKVWNKICSLKPNWQFVEIPFKEWHTSRYLKQCYYNLEEKFDCGGISPTEWELILSYVTEKFS